MNMDYCKFENAAADLKVCVDALFSNQAEDKDLSESEIRAKKQLLKLCREVTEEYMG